MLLEEPKGKIGNSEPDVFEKDNSHHQAHHSQVSQMKNINLVVIGRTIQSFV